MSPGPGPEKDTDTASSPVPGRMDERLLGAGTGPRFLLLISLFVTSSASMTSAVFHSLVDPRNMASGCALASGLDPRADFLGASLATLRSDEAFRACVDRFVPHASPWPVPAAVVALVLAACVLYWTLPRWKQRGRRLVPVEGIDPHGELGALLDELVDVAGLSRRPRFVVSPAARTASAVVFGRWRHHVVCLHGGLVAIRDSDARRFRAVVLHELAHIHNRDVDITYATVALWRVFLFAVLPGYLVWAVLALRDALSSAVFGPPSLVATSRDVAFTAVLIALVFLTRADILRTRELYADADAIRWGADPAGWGGATGSAASDRGRLGRAARALAAAWRSHPGWDRRRRALADAQELFHSSALTLFLTGATASICAGELYGFGAGWVVRLAAATVAGLIATTVAVNLWRAAARAVLTGVRAPSGLRAGWWLGAGLVLGEVLTGGVSGWRVLPRHPEVFALLVVISVVVTCWTAQFADLALRCWRGSRLRPAFAAGLTATLVAFALTYDWWHSSGRIFAAGWPFSEPAIRAALQHDLPGPALGASTLTVIAVVLSMVLPWEQDPLLWAVTALWVLPLLVWGIGAADKAPAWAVRALPPGEGAVWRAERLPSFRRLAVAAGLGAGGAWLGVVVVLARIHAVRPPVGQPLGQQALLVVAWLFVVLAAVVVAAATVTGSVTPRLPVPAAAVAAGTAGLAGVTAAFLLLSADGCVRSLATMGTTCAWLPGGAWPLTELLLPLVLGLALFVSVFTAVVATAVLRLRRRPRPDVGDRDRRTRLRPARDGGHTRAPARKAAVAAVCLIALTLITAASLPMGTGGHSGAHTSLTRQDLIPAQNTRPAEEVLALQTDAWLRLGGRELLVKMTGEVLHIMTALQDDRAFTDHGYAARAIRPHCLGLRTAAQRLGAYFPVPDPDVARQRPTLATQGRRIGTNCRQAIDEGKRDLYLASMNDVVTLSERLSGVLREVTAEAGHHPGQ
ncbi:M48 family metalloprotease [Streptomyces sp. NPDC046870]|uniref:M48 family metalloprotease n=1 Tax=Streptomyces sp. NPDC046870 TaxID=3155135 RepID=UPI0034568FA4